LGGAEDAYPAVKITAAIVGRGRCFICFRLVVFEFVSLKTSQGEFYCKENGNNKKESLQGDYHFKDKRMFFPIKSKKVYVKFARLERGYYYPNHKTSEAR